MKLISVASIQFFWSEPRGHGHRWSLEGQSTGKRVSPSYLTLHHQQRTTMQVWLSNAAPVCLLIAYSSSYPNLWTKPQDTTLFGVATHYQSKENNPPFPEYFKIGSVNSYPCHFKLAATVAGNLCKVTGRLGQQNYIICYPDINQQDTVLPSVAPRDSVCENYKQIKRQQAALVESNTHYELAFGKHYGLACISLALLFRAVKSTGKK